MKAKLLAGNLWRYSVARHILPVLALCARDRRTLYYSEAKNIISKTSIHPGLDVLYGKPAGVIGDALIELASQEGDDPYPPINALLVAKATDLPSHGVDYYIATYLNIPENKINDRSRMKYANIVFDKIFQFKEWDFILDKLCGKSIPNINFDEISTEPNSKSSNKYGKGNGESEEHIKLKKFVAKNPTSIGLQKNTREGIIERSFISADKVDVFFSTNKTKIAVECKSHRSSNPDLLSGIYQCAKYRALLQAEQLIDESDHNVESILVTGRVIPNKYRAFLDKLGIAYVFISPDRV